MADSVARLLAELERSQSSIICRHPHGATRVYPRAFVIESDVAISAEIEVEGEAEGRVVLTPNLASRIPDWRRKRREVALRVAQSLGVELSDGESCWQKDGYEIRYEEAWGDFSFAISPTR